MSPEVKTSIMKMMDAVGKAWHKRPDTNFVSVFDVELARRRGVDPAEAPAAELILERSLAFGMAMGFRVAKLMPDVTEDDLIKEFKAIEAGKDQQNQA